MRQSSAYKRYLQRFKPYKLHEWEYYSMMDVWKALCKIRSNNTLNDVWTAGKAKRAKQKSINKLQTKAENKQYTAKLCDN